jgi:hypothetical protein
MEKILSDGNEVGYAGKVLHGDLKASEGVRCQVSAQPLAAEASKLIE